MSGNQGVPTVAGGQLWWLRGKSPQLVKITKVGNGTASVRHDAWPADRTVRVDELAWTYPAEHVIIEPRNAQPQLRAQRGQRR